MKMRMLVVYVLFMGTIVGMTAISWFYPERPGWVNWVTTLTAVAAACLLVYVLRKSRRSNPPAKLRTTAATAGPCGARLHADTTQAETSNFATHDSSILESLLVSGSSPCMLLLEAYCSIAGSI